MKEDIEPNLFKITFNSLNKAVDKGFGSISYDHPDFDFLNELKQNNGVFAAFKTHRQQNDLARQLLNENGELKSFDQFRKDTEAIIGEYNRNWLKTEYDTAVIRAQMAARFKEFQRDADLYPNLKWLPSTSAVKREPHKELYGLILPITDKFWTSQYPGSLWNCKCGITNTDEPANGKAFNIDKYDMPAPPAGLEGNPAFTGQIYSFAHPFFTAGYLAYTKLSPIVSKWLYKRFKDVPPAFPIYDKIASGKNVAIRATRYFKPGDYSVSEEFARKLVKLYKEKEPLNLYILPELKPDVKDQNWLRKYLLPKSTPISRNPDYYINGNLFDLKTLTTKSTSKVQDRLMEAVDQAGNAIIDYKGRLTFAQLMSAIKGQAMQSSRVGNVWVVYNKKLYMFTRAELLSYKNKS